MPSFQSCLLICLFFPLAAYSQEVQVSLLIPPPYPNSYEAFLKFSDQTVVTLSNLSSAPLSVKLASRIHGPDGEYLAVKDSFRPRVPIQLNPGETRVLTGSMLRQIFRNLAETDFELSGFDRRTLIQTGTVPEGIYKVCLQVLDYQTSRPISTLTEGCTAILISHYDPPVILQPGRETVIYARYPPMIPFSWTPGGQPALTHYRFELVDMSLNHLFNPNEAFENAGLRPTFSLDGLRRNTLLYDLSFPPLQPGHRYALRVTAYDPSRQTAFKHQGRSEVIGFTYLAAPARPTTPLQPWRQAIDDQGENVLAGLRKAGIRCRPEAAATGFTPLPTEAVRAGMQIRLGSHQVTLEDGFRITDGRLDGKARLDDQSGNPPVFLLFEGLQLDHKAQTVNCLTLFYTF